MYASFWLWLVVLASLGAVALPDGRVIMCGGGYIELAEGGRVSTKVGWPEMVVKKPNLNVVTFISKWSIVSIKLISNYVPKYRIFRQTFVKFNKHIFMK